MKKMRFKLIILYLAISGVISSDVYSNSGRNMIGVVGNTELIGAMYEYKLYNNFGIKLVGLYIPGLGLNENEYIYNATSAAVLHIIERVTVFDPVILFGANYSYHHWELENSDNNGEFQDVTVGGGLGLGITFSERVRLGLNVWVNYDYRIIETDNSKQKGSRYFLVMPIVDISYVF